jgi:molybdenum-dependent DNA-binding transcriptional regulator ModE
MLRQKTAEFEIRDKNLFAEMSQISEKMKGVDGGQATQRCVMLLARYKKLEIDYEAALKKLDQSSELKNQLLDKEVRFMNCKLKCAPIYVFF